MQGAASDVSSEHQVHEHECIQSGLEASLALIAGLRSPAPLRTTLRQDAKVHLLRKLEDTYNANTMWHQNREYKFTFHAYPKLNQDLKCTMAPC